MTVEQLRESAQCSREVVDASWMKDESRSLADADQTKPEGDCGLRETGFRSSAEGAKDFCHNYPSLLGR